MNTVINELAQECEVNGSFDREKFARLIIEDCIKTCRKQPTTWPIAYLEFCDVIKQHFELH